MQSFSQLSQIGSGGQLAATFLEFPEAGNFDVSFVDLPKRWCFPAADAETELFRVRLVEAWRGRELRRRAALLPAVSAETVEGDRRASCKMGRAPRGNAAVKAAEKAATASIPAVAKAVAPVDAAVKGLVAAAAAVQAAALEPKGAAAPAAAAVAAPKAPKAPASAKPDVGGIKAAVVEGVVGGVAAPGGVVTAPPVGIGGGVGGNYAVSRIGSNKNRMGQDLPCLQKSDRRPNDCTVLPLSHNIRSRQCGAPRVSPPQSSRGCAQEHSTST